MTASGWTPRSVGRHAVDDPLGSHVGLVNVDDRLRAAFGEDYGLIVETAQGAGTKVIVRLPKFAPGVDRGPVTAGRALRLVPGGSTPGCWGPTARTDAREVPAVGTRVGSGSGKAR